MSVNTIKSIHTFVAYCLSLVALIGTITTAFAGFSGALNPQTSQVITAILIAVAGIAGTFAALGQSMLKAFGDNTTVSVEVPKVSLIDDVAAAAATQGKSFVDGAIENIVNDIFGKKSPAPVVNPAPVPPAQPQSNPSPSGANFVPAPTIVPEGTQPPSQS